MTSATAPRAVTPGSVRRSVYWTPDTAGHMWRRTARSLSRSGNERRAVATPGDRTRSVSAVVLGTRLKRVAPAATMNGMPRADRVTLSAAGLDMPAVDDMSNKSSHNVILDRTISGKLPGIPSSRTLVGVFTNFVRLTDKALREYDAARAELIRYVAPQTSLRTSPYLRAIDHMENCVSATHRAVLNARALQARGIGRSGPRLTANQEQRLSFLRNAVEHSDERILGTQKSGRIPTFTSGEPYSLRLANTSMIIGDNVLTYKELVSAMKKMYRTIEAIRGVSTGTPGPRWPNARLRTDPGRGPEQSSSIAVSEYLNELSRLAVTH
jgi:hypothetical protein